jgi:hypothetical protein
MQRLTQKLSDGNYSVVSKEEAVIQLGKYEDFYQALEQEYQEILSKMEALSSAGKVKSATYRQLFSNKLTLSGLLDRFRRHFSN